MIHTCYKDKSKTYLNPIIDWQDGDVWEFIHQENIPYCTLYDEGFTRLGCILCPMSSNQEQEAARWPQFVEAYIHTFNRLLVIRTDLELKHNFSTGQDLFNWWIGRCKRSRRPDDQLVLFE